MPSASLQETFAIAVHYHQTGRLADAEKLYCQLLAAQPEHAGALHLRGVIAHQIGRHEIAIELISRSLALEPGNADALSNLGEAYRASGRLAEAVVAYRDALLLKPHYPEVLNNLAAALASQGHLVEAADACSQAIRLKPAYFEAHNNLGSIVQDQGKAEEAITEFRRALAINPNAAEAHDNLGVALRAAGQISEAIAAHERAISLRPAFPKAFIHLGNAFFDLKQTDQAIAAFHRAIEIKPDSGVAYNNLAVALCHQGMLPEALEASRKAVHFKPGDPLIRSNLIYTHYFCPDMSARQITDECSQWNRIFGGHRLSERFDNDPNPDRRLCVAYISPNFCEHVIGRNLLPLFANHSRKDCEIFCYSDTDRADSVTKAFQNKADHWREVTGVRDDSLARIIRDNRIDILVDLTQHMNRNRLSLVALSAAPVQVSFAGYPESTGVEAIEYRISDSYLECGMRNAECGMAVRNEFRNESVFLIDTFWCYDPCGAVVEVNELPAKHRGHITFGCLNNFSKVNEPLLKLWARVLKVVPESHMLVLAAFGSHRQRTASLLENEGVSPERVEFVEPRPREEYLELYHRLDIVLDTFPYNGHTTSLDALWMGVPVVSLAGERPVSRGGLSQLCNLGLSELVAFTEADYVRIAGELARDLPRLEELRRTLRGRMESSVLMDAPRFARNIEAAYRAMWRRWCTQRA